MQFRERDIATRRARRKRKGFWKNFYVPDESVIVELGEPVGQVVERDRRNFLKIVIFEEGVLDQPVRRPGVRFRQIKIVLSIVQHLNKRKREEEKEYIYIYPLSINSQAQMLIITWPVVVSNLYNLKPGLLGPPGVVGDMLGAIIIQDTGRPGGTNLFCHVFTSHVRAARRWKDVRGRGGRVELWAADVNHGTM